MKVLLLTTAGVVGLGGAQYLGQWGDWPVINTYEAGYVHDLRNHFYLTAALTALAVGFFGMIVKASLDTIKYVVILVGVIFIFGSHGIGTGSTENLEHALHELVIPYIGVASPIVLVMYSIAKKLKRVEHN